MRRIIMMLLGLGCFHASDVLARESPGLLSDAKSWATLPHPEQKVPFAEATNDPEGFLGAFDPPPGERVRAGWFGEFGAVIMSPRMAGTRASNLAVPLFRSIFPSLETADISRAYGPEVMFGYRNPGLGELQLRYQGVYAEESESRSVLPRFPFVLIDTVPIDQVIQLNALTTTRYRTRFRTHAIDALMSTDRVNVSGPWDVQFGGGVRYATFFLEDRAESRFISQFARNTFDGIGPLLGLDVHRQLLGPSDGFLMWLHARVEGSYLFGNSRQALGESLSTPVTLIAPTGSRSSDDRSTPRLAAEIGVSFADLPSHHVRGTIGYRFDRWFDVGKSGGSDFDLMMQGGFVRVEWNY